VLCERSRFRSRTNRLCKRKCPALSQFPFAVLLDGQGCVSDIDFEMVAQLVPQHVLRSRIFGTRSRQGFKSLTVGLFIFGLIPNLINCDSLKIPKSVLL
jgi:hypothetical protein